MEPFFWVVLALGIFLFLLLAKSWLRLYRRNRRARSEFGKTTMHESSLRKSRSHDAG